ncbi:adenosine kinase [Ancylobacter pratisalsi]|uniref:Adenosine kinase n=1 Tax=Ancylobacter pratisalsi TaxID=1745854 RepID=A0A6P1YL48_9HYPH|nr:adenosine kinase [Ancylobacter pratisalsi]QIB33855.1 adenosine kinase [Ancylobacter pratisalsi]
MTAQQLDVIGFGNAIVDVISRAEEAFLLTHDMRKGGMTLIDEPRAEAVYGAMGPGVEISGGSAANTMVGIAALGGRAGFIGKVRDDELGGIFAHDIRAAGVAFGTPAAAAGPTTARCLILVTPDGERTMNTFLGAAQDLSPVDVDAGMVASATVTYLEGYLWDPPPAKEAFLKAADIAHKAGRTVALTLSDAFCVGRYRDEFLKLIREGVVDLVFANEAELMSLYETDFDTALGTLRREARRAVVTRSEKGALSVAGDEMASVDAFPVAKVVDTTGAGDLFAAGYLHGFARGFSPEESLKLGALCAAEIISHIGARPEKGLKALAAENGLRV